MEIEMYIGSFDRTWHTEFVTIPSDTLSNEIESLAISTMLKVLEDSGVDDIVFVGVYQHCN